MTEEKVHQNGNGVYGGTQVSVSPSQVDLVSAEAKEIPDDEEFDPWAMPELKDTGTPWAELSGCGKVKRVIVLFLKIVLLLSLLYLFICSLDFLSSAFQLLGGKAAGKAFSESEVLSNPVAGLMIGVLATVLVQSSSTSTSIVVTMVAAGILTVEIAIPIVMGANIGTSVTNTIVSMAQSADRNEFRRAFAGATVHDMFNWLTVILLLPLEVATGYLFYLSKLCIDSMDLSKIIAEDQDFLKVITKPFTKLVISLDKKIINAIAKGDEAAASKSLQKEWCKKVSYTENQIVVKNVTFPDGKINMTVWNETVNGWPYRNIGNTYIYNETIQVEKTNYTASTKCNYLFTYFNLDDTVAGVILLIAAIAILCICLILMVKTLHSLLRGSMAKVIKKTINANFPGKLAFLTGYVAILVGAGMTMLVQSSSIFTSTLTPLVGIGVVSLERTYPLTLGSNIGTTVTSILAALAASGSQIGNSLQISLCHLFFNISGILLFYPIPFTRVPIKLAKGLGNTTAKYRWFAILYLIAMFFLLPGAVFALSLAGGWVLFGVGTPIALFIVVVVIINIIQSKKPSCLPAKLRTWNFLPLWMHSFRPLDRVISKLLCCKKCKPDENEQNATDKKLQGETNVAYQEEKV